MSKKCSPHEKKSCLEKVKKIKKGPKKGRDDNLEHIPQFLSNISIL